MGARVEARAHRFAVDIVAALAHRGVFGRHGQRPVNAVADLLQIEHAEARRLVTAAEQARPRVAVLPGTAAALDAGAASLRHVEVISRLLDGPAARRLDPDTWAAAETQLAAHTGDYTIWSSTASVCRRTTRLMEGPSPARASISRLEVAHQFRPHSVTVDLCR